MARIRSLHPGVATDEDLVACSRDARLFYLLLLTECDDQGVFEWKPLTLKMKLFPADNIDIEPLLSELVAHNKVAAYEIERRKLGAVRNFRKWQRPKSPNSIYAITDDIRSYVALTGQISEMDEDEPPLIPPDAEKSPQMEDVGGRRKDEGGKESLPRPTRSRAPDPDFNRWYAAYPKHEARGHAEQAFVKARKSASLEELIAGAERYAAIVDRRENGRFVALPATWLNQKRWLDEAAGEGNPIGGAVPERRKPRTPAPGDGGGEGLDPGLH